MVGPGPGRRVGRPSHPRRQSIPARALADEHPGDEGPAERVEFLVGAQPAVEEEACLYTLIRDGSLSPDPAIRLLIWVWPTTAFSEQLTRPAA
jgi:hypothetical protein